MKSYYLLLAVLSFTLVVSCKKEEEVIKEPVQEQLDPTVSYDLTDVAYGSDPEQVMDIYLPANRSAESTQVFFLIHGGGWSAGDKENFQSTFNALKFVYPDCAIVNMNYRLVSRQCKKPTAQTAHLVFADTKANAEMRSIHEHR